MGFEMQIADGFDHGIFQVLAIVGHEVGQGRVFGMTPHRLDRVQVRRVGRQPLHVQPSGATFTQLSHGGPMHVQSIHHYQQFSTVLAVQLLQIAHDLWGTHVVVV